MNIRPRIFAVLALAPALAPLGGCGLAGLLRAPDDRPAANGAAYRSTAESAPPTDGAIYASGREIAYFQDLKARRKGDLITIRLQESTNASKTSSTESKKDSTAAITGPTLLGRPVTVNGTEVLSGALDGTRSFKGTGTSSQQNALTGSITAVVAEVLPNGNLVVEGEKWLRLNQGDELVKVRGVVRPFDVLADNSVTSDRVADARISYAGRGALADANKQGWLARFFNSPVFPY